MATPTLFTRAALGRPLTHIEGDANFTALAAAFDQLPYGLNLYARFRDSNGEAKGDLVFPTDPATGLHNDGFEGGSRLEPSVIVIGATEFLYCTSTLSYTSNTVCVATRPVGSTAWSVPVRCVGMGSGGAPADRRAHSSYALYVNGTVYLWYLNGYGPGAGQDRNVYLATSTDGLTFIDRGLAVDKTSIAGLQGFGNACVVPRLQNGLYSMLLEGMNAAGVWEISLFTAPSLLNGPWTFEQKLTSMEVVPGSMYGGAWCDYVVDMNGVGLYHALYHFGSGQTLPNGQTDANLPTYLAWATSPDLRTWTIKQAPWLRIEDFPFGPLFSAEEGTNQAADPYVKPLNGRATVFFELVENPPGVTKNQLRSLSFNGSLSQLFTPAAS